MRVNKGCRIRFSRDARYECGQLRYAVRGPATPASEENLITIETITQLVRSLDLSAAAGYSTLGFPANDSLDASYRKPRLPAAWCVAYPPRRDECFLANHAKDLVSVEFIVVSAALFDVLFVFVILPHDRHRPVHFAITKHPSNMSCSIAVGSLLLEHRNRAIYCAIWTGAMERSSVKRRTGWVFAKSSLHRDRLEECLPQLSYSSAWSKMDGPAAS